MAHQVGHAQQVPVKVLILVSTDAIGDKQGRHKMVW
jgi:hypothetical protein